ncbi:MAG TPA: 50S ribosomal protein L25 [bacterium]|nr:50S ribosomal protein L25 [bacterium]HOL46645.1 50S ribosomal protein L25 [bacterium]HPQ17784.1 50S ribosomal protein L25 [bacterium]
MEKIVLEVEKLKKTAKGSIKRMRNAGYIPAILYGKKVGNIQLAVPKQKIVHLFHHTPHIESVIIELLIKNGDTITVNSIIRDFQTDFCSGKLLHLDFLEVLMDEKLKLNVPIKFTGESIGVKNGGILEVLLNEVEIECLPADIPSEMTIDISNLNIGDSLHIKDIKTTDKIKIISDPESVILLVAAPTIEEEKPKVEEAAAAAEGAAAAPAEGAAQQPAAEASKQASAKTDSTAKK